MSRRHSTAPAIMNDSKGKRRVSNRRLNTVRFRRLIIGSLPAYRWEPTLCLWARGLPTLKGNDQLSQPPMPVDCPWLCVGLRLENGAGRSGRSAISDLGYWGTRYKTV